MGEEVAESWMWEGWPNPEAFMYQVGSDRHMGNSVKGKPWDGPAPCLATPDSSLEASTSLVDAHFLGREC